MPAFVVASGQRRSRGGLAQCRAQLRVQAGCRRLLDDLLMAALQGAVALEQVDRLPVPVGEHLHLDVARPIDQPLEQHAVVAERGLGLAPAGGERLEEVARRSSTRRMPLPPPPATALISSGKPIPLGLVAQARVRLIGAVIARHERHAGRRQQRLGAVLAAQPLHRLGRRTDEDEARVAHARANAALSDRKP